MKEQEEIIEKIRRGYGVGVVFHGEAAEVVANLQRKLNQSLKVISEEMYPKETHFVLELVQNAEDNTYKPDVQPSLCFRLAPDRLVLVNNEIGFTPENVVALCDAGASTKATRLGFIGEKGIGFKSVFLASGAPEVHSAGFHFRFVLDQKTQLSYVLPWWIDEPDPFVDPTKTTIMLPAREGKFQRSLLSELKPELLLFLRKLRHLEIEYEDDGYVECMTRQDHEGHVLLTHRRGLGADVTQTEKSFFVVRFSCSMEDLHEPKRVGVAETEILLAFPLQSVEARHQTERFQVFAFLPVRESGLPFIVQGDFILDAGRADIMRKKEWNERIRNHVPAAFMQGVEQFKCDDHLKNTYLRFVPLREDGVDGFFAPLVKEMLAGLRDMRSMRTESGEWRFPAEVVIPRDNCRNLVPSDQLQSLLGKEYVHPDLVASEDVLLALGCQVFCLSHLLECLKNEDWVASHDTSWFGVLYNYLARCSPSNADVKMLQGLRILRLSTGEVSAAEDGKVFFPLDNSRSYGFEHELRVIEARTIGMQGKEGSGGARELLERIGVRDTSATQVIEQHILPSYTSGAWKGRSEEARFGYLAYLRDNLENYLKAKEEEAPHSVMRQSMRRDALKALQGAVVVKIKGTADATESHENPNAIYLGKRYGDPDDLEGHLAGMVTAKFVSEDYATRSRRTPEQDDENTNRWMHFFSTLGVHSCPRVVASGKHPADLPPSVQSRLWSAKSSTDWVASPELSALVGSVDENAKRWLLRVLGTNWKNVYSRFASAKVEGQTYSGRYAYPWSESMDSSFLREIRAMLVPVAEGKWEKLEQTYLDKDEVRVAFGSRVPYLSCEGLSDDFLDAVRVVHRVDAGTLLDRLRRLSSSNATDKDEIRKIYRGLELRCEGDRERIREGFQNEQLIFVPSQGGQPGRWTSGEKTCWNTLHTFFSRVVPSLDHAYPEHARFFTEQIGIRRRLDPNDLIEVLRRLDAELGKELDASKAGSVARIVYEELAWWVRHPPQGAGDVSRPKWVDAIQEGGLFWTNKQEFLPDQGNLFVNDRPELGARFESSERIAFLAVPQESLPRLREFTRVTELRAVSDSINKHFRRTENHLADRALCHRVRSVAREIERWVFFKDPKAYKRLKGVGRFEELSRLDLFVEPELNVTIKLGPEAQMSRCDAIEVEGAIYVDSSAVNDNNSIGVELGKFLDLSGEVSAYLTLLLEWAGDQARIEKFLRSHGVGPLPGTEESGREDWGEQVQGKPTNLPPRIQGAGSGEPQEHGVGGADEEPPTVSAPSMPTIGKPPGLQEAAANGPDLVQPPHEPQSVSPSGQYGISRRVESEEVQEEGPAQGGEKRPISSRAPLTDDDSGSQGCSLDEGTQIDEPSDSGPSPMSPQPPTIPGQGSSEERPGSFKKGSSETRGPIRGTTIVKGPRERSSSEGTGDTTAQDIGEAAENWVVEWEGKKGRTATRMPRNHEGWDIESEGPDGLRYVEVKGIDGPWDGWAVAVSAPQFEASKERGGKWWLYVVEYARTPDRRRIHPIQNPFMRAEEYLLDHPWQHAAEGRLEMIPPSETPEIGARYSMDDGTQVHVLSMEPKGKAWKVKVSLPGGDTRWMAWNPAWRRV